MSNSIEKPSPKYYIEFTTKDGVVSKSEQFEWTGGFIKSESTEISALRAVLHLVIGGFLTSQFDKITAETDAECDLIIDMCKEFVRLFNNHHFEDIMLELAQSILNDSMPLMSDKKQAVKTHAIGFERDVNDYYKIPQISLSQKDCDQIRLNFSTLVHIYESCEKYYEQTKWKIVIVS